MEQRTDLRRWAGPIACTASSAGLIAASLPPWDLGWLAWFSLVPWLVALRGATGWREAAILGWALSAAMGLLVAPWVATAASEFLQLGPIASAGILLLFALVAAQPHLVIAALVARWVVVELGRERRPAHAWLLAFGLACTWVLLDRWVPRLFDVGLGYALHDMDRLRQLADLAGVPLLTGWIVFTNALLAQAWIRLRDGASRRTLLAGHGFVLAALFAAAYSYGEVRLDESATAAAAPERVLDVAALQGNVENEVRLAWARGDERAAEKQLSAYMLPTQDLVDGSPRPDLVVWPEASFPGVFGQPASRAQRGRANKFTRQVTRLDTPIVFGAYDRSGDGAGEELWNALFAISPAGRRGAAGSVQRYHKHRLLPFAETLPGLSRDGWLRGVLPGVAAFARGEGPALLELPGPEGSVLRVAPAICSESMSSSHALAGARMGADLLLNVGSDGWFRDSGEPEFHLAIARMRSVETRLPQVRVANTGISALILPSGEVTHRSALGTAELLRWRVPLQARDSSRGRAGGGTLGATILLGGVLGLVALALGGRWSSREARSSGRA